MTNFMSIIFRPFVQLLPILLFASLFIQTKAQESYEISLLNSSHGLPSDEVTNMHQDSRGFLWFSTTEGLIRYDGYELKVFSIAKYHNKGLITNTFNDITEDEEGNLWCATDRGIAHLDVQTETFNFFNTQSASPFTLSYDVINTLAIDHNGQIWIGSSGYGVEVLSPENGIVKTYNISSGNIEMNSNWITKILNDAQNNTWICSWKGDLTVINNETGLIKTWTGQDLNLELDIPHFSPFSIIQSKNNDYWLGLWEGGLINFSLENDSIVIHKHIMQDKENEPSIAGNIIYDLTMDKDGDLWIGTPYGLTLVKNPKSKEPSFLQFKNDKPGYNISQNEAYSLLCDSSGLIWVGTSGGGINKIDNKVRIFNTYTIPETSKITNGRSVSAFSEDQSGRLLIGVRSLGFGSYNLKDQSFIQYSDLAPYSDLPDEINTVNCFYWDEDQNLWLGTRYQGLIKFNPETGQSITINKNNTDFDFDARAVFDIYEDHLGYIWVGTENGLYKITSFSPHNFQNFSILRYSHDPDNPYSISSNRISSILQDSSKALWIGTFDHGINKLTSNIKTHYPLIFKRYQASDKKKNGLITDHIITLFEDDSQNIWIGSGGGGLFRWFPPEEKFIQYNSQIPGDIIYNISQDSKRNIWVSSNRGITKMKSDSNEIHANSFIQDNGLQSNIFNKDAFYIDSKGYFYFGGNRGFNYFDPLAIQTDEFIPPVVITDLKVVNESVQSNTTANNPLVLSHLKNNIAVSFSALSFSQPENNKYAVRLDGLEKDWRSLDANMRTLNYANLKPGRYTLKIKGSNSHGHWNPIPEELFIKVNPAPYKTWWALTIYVLMFSGIFFLFFKMVRKTQRVKQDLQIEHIERQKSDNLNHFKQGLFSNISHEFLTPLSILSCLIDDWKYHKTMPDRKDLSLADRNINRLNRLNRQFLYYSKAEVEKLPVDVSANNLNLFVRNICENFSPLAKKNQIHFNWDIQCPESNMWFDQEKIDIILYNLLSNAFKFTPVNGNISLNLSLKKSENKTLAVFSVKDTGKGIKKEQQKMIFNRYHSLKSDSHKSGGFGIGLSLTKSMIEAHKGTINMESVVGEGTTVIFSLPVNKNAFSSEETGNNNKDHFSSSLMLNEDVEEETINRLRDLTQAYENKPTVLIVEDHSDFRKFLKNNLNEIFSVVEAPNGVVGFEMARNKKVDLIISDVLMPAMNGIELCEKIKNNEDTSHIPVILLTAKSSEIERTQGYRAGADSYLTKPFNLNTLLARMEALLEQQKRVVTLLSQTTSSVKINAHSAKDDSFLSNAREIIEKNIANPDLSVKMLTKELSISNSMLYRKISELLNINPNTFIRKMRMMKAAEMLKENNSSISEVAFQCGFKDVSYFGYTFKKDYGISPSQYQKQNT